MTTPWGYDQPSTFDARDAAEADTFAGGHYPRLSGGWCDWCGYRTDAPGHVTECVVEAEIIDDGEAPE